MILAIIIIVVGLGLLGAAMAQGRTSIGPWFWTNIVLGVILALYGGLVLIAYSY